MNLIIASNNAGKLKEIQEILDLPQLKFFSLQDFSSVPELREPHSTYLENAREKAKTVAEFFQKWALADDSGLEVIALDGQPGVYSARYAGEAASALENNLKLLSALKERAQSQRQAVFKCCLVLRSPQGEEYIAEGSLEGEIAVTLCGEKGFGYDPIFYVPEKNQVLAQMSAQEKNQISHRRQALDKMKVILNGILLKTVS